MGIRHLRAPLIATSLLFGLACTAILNPRDDVQRCGSATDCKASEDNRYVVECIFPEDSELDSTEVSKVCVADFKPLSCNAMDLMSSNPDHPLAVVWDSLSLGTRYACDDEFKGAKGCQPRDDQTCNDGLTLANGYCNDGDQSVRYLGSGELMELRGQDVLDQYCRQFFCDNDFVCDTTDFTCVKCDDDAPFGEGGCGEVYVNGAPSCVYTPDVESVCDEGDAVEDEPHFGCETP